MGLEGLREWGAVDRGSVEKRRRWVVRWGQDGSGGGVGGIRWEWEGVEEGEVNKMQGRRRFGGGDRLEGACRGMKVVGGEAVRAGGRIDGVVV